MKRLGFAVVVVAVVGCQSDRVLPAPSALIQDALNNGGNPFFFWTPPVVNQQPPSTQIFSANVSPVITIKNLCDGTVVRTFSGSQIGVSNARYHANWATSVDNLNSACTYRLIVTVGRDTLGFADVNVVENGRELKNVNTDEFIPLLDDRTLPITFFVGVGSLCGDVADCGEGVARGGENTTIVTTSGRAGVFIPADALDPGVEVRITVESVDDARGEFECIPNLFQQFPGTADVADNACYDYHAEQISPPTDQTGRFTFQKT